MYGGTAQLQANLPFRLEMFCRLQPPAAAAAAAAAAEREKKNLTTSGFLGDQRADNDILPDVAAPALGPPATLHVRIPVGDGIDLGAYYSSGAQTDTSKMCQPELGCSRITWGAARYSGQH
ncbi:hypothetical protein CMUS01_07453 [Colletotrichum musicola]|uniref:Uncharacterized protein n=1 Tax=Colletotrichum musicola TaxID=2175873 RepID=A0A8H6KGN5_9PEZI|nr:hypothetical protein CMUS01_07453 [Colletotrichum musicola]